MLLVNIVSHGLEKILFTALDFPALFVFPVVLLAAGRSLLLSAALAGARQFCSGFFESRRQLRYLAILLLYQS